ncbi:diadenylate cyclase [Rubritalea squalenifaciens DSM 18772]|uniref:Diadenylate cyclase n=2 Tax=Rubritalea TaxID=361050 RepID=A0A1M6IY11_9BACT|nr:diadenylate cyclase CdaA [Rubritalea squalenifaciens]SHJ39324.1 diadenylate cyclase [Rubritalea squalenifaciens DSM 18772]
MDFILNHWKDGIEILILWVGIYQIYRAFRATRGARILVGIIMILAVVTSLAFILELRVIGWILIHSTLWIAFALVIIFQPELRTALAKLGSSRLFSFSKTQRLEFTGVFASAVIQLSKKRIGALFALEREISLKEHQDTGVILDAEFSPELALTVFFPKTALHDGGMILSQGRMAAAGCVFPVSQKEMNDRTLGLRHRAAVGLTEETDAVAVVVSEETGAISVAINGDLERNLSEEEFREMLEAIFLPEESQDDEDVQETLDSEDHSIDPSDSDLVSDKS